MSRKPLPSAADGGVYYNENDPFAAAWLRELIRQQLIPDGVVDQRDICDVKPNDLAGFHQCHFFAGIGGWPYALQLAGWPHERRVWTGSCPCQPLSVAGNRRGHADKRHLWPAFHALISECRPAAVFGEQVASRDGREWLAAVRADMEAGGYTVGAADLCAAGVGAPHIRQRLFWVADPDSERQFRTAGREEELVEVARSKQNNSEPMRLADAAEQGWGWWRHGGTDGRQTAESGRLRDAGGQGNSLWGDADWLGCRDGKWRPVEPGTFPLAHGVPARVGRLRGYGNAIVPKVAAEFIKAFMTI